VNVLARGVEINVRTQVQLNWKKNLSQSVGVSAGCEEVELVVRERLPEGQGGGCDRRRTTLRPPGRTRAR